MSQPLQPGTIMLAIVDAGSVRSQTAVSLLATAIETRLIGAVAHQSSPRVPAARNALVRRFLETELEWLWFVDTDMMFGPEVLTALHQVADPETRPVVGGLCFGIDGREVHPILLRRRPRSPKYDLVVDWSPGEVIEVDATGAACLLIHRSVLETLRERYPAPNHWFADEVHDGIDTGHDVVFCERVRSLGLGVAVHTGVEIGHLKDRRADPEAYRRWLRHHRFLLVGTGGCGLRRAALLLTRLKIPTGYEQVYNARSVQHGGVDWAATRGEASWLAAPFLPHFNGDVVHLVAPPLEVLGRLISPRGLFSAESVSERDGAFAFSFRGAGREPPRCSPTERAERIRWAVAHYLRWNWMIEPHASLRVRGLPLGVAELDSVARVVGAPRDQEALESVLDSRAETADTEGGQQPLAPEELPEDLAPELRQLSRRYGFEL